MITFECACGQSLQVPEEHAGLKVRCPKCQATVTAPPSAAIQAAPAAAEVLEGPPTVSSAHEITIKPLDSNSPRPPASARDDADDDRPRRRRSRDDDEGRPQTSGKAITALVFGCVTFLIPILCAIPAIIFGILGLVETKKEPRKFKGSGLALAGIILGVAGNVSLGIYFYMLLVPATNRVREAAERTMLSNNLKQIGIAMFNYESTYRRYPQPGLTNPPFTGPTPLLSWRVSLLPYIEQDNLYRQFKLDEPWDSPHNIKLLPMIPPVYAPVGKQPPPGIQGGTYLQMVTGPNTIFPKNNFGLRLTGITDGLSNTVLVVESSSAVPWTKPEDIQFDPRGPAPLPKLGAFYPDKVFALLADSSVRIIERRATSDQTIRLAIDPNDGQMMPPDW